MVNLIRVFPRRTSYTPTDDYTFIGDPPLWIPNADEIHISVTFTWDKAEAERLQQAWQSRYPDIPVRIGGPAFGGCNHEFTAGIYVKQGVTFTSRGCNNYCSWCLVPKREGCLRTLPIVPGYIIQDNNFLQCPQVHRQQVYAMLRQQRHATVFAGGLQADLITEEIAEELRSARIHEVYLACDTDARLPGLRNAVRRLGFLARRQLRCYVLCGFAGQTLDAARQRLEAVWDVGCLPFAQLYQPPDRWISYSREWRQLARLWSRPAAMFDQHKLRKER